MTMSEKIPEGLRYAVREESLTVRGITLGAPTLRRETHDPESD